jgi:hypothetical protein
VTGITRLPMPSSNKEAVVEWDVRSSTCPKTEDALPKGNIHNMDGATIFPSFVQFSPGQITLHIWSPSNTTTPIV